MMEVVHTHLSRGYFVIDPEQPLHVIVKSCTEIDANLDVDISKPPGYVTEKCELHHFFICGSISLMGISAIDILHDL